MALYIKNAKDKTAQQGRCKMHIISFFYVVVIKVFQSSG